MKTTEIMDEYHFNQTLLKKLKSDLELLGEENTLKITKYSDEIKSTNGSDQADVIIHRILKKENIEAKIKDVENALRFVENAFNALEQKYRNGDDIKKFLVFKMRHLNLKQFHVIEDSLNISRATCNRALSKVESDFERLMSTA